MAQPLQVAILVFNEVEILDFAGPFEVFSVASRVAQRDGFAAAAPFEPFLLSKTGNNITTRHGIALGPHRSLEDAGAPDVLIVCGGIVTEPLSDPDIIAWIKNVSTSTKVTASVCTGAFVLARAGLLEGLRATTHWEDIPDLRLASPGTVIEENVSYVDQERIVTSAGISAGIEMSLHLVGRLANPRLADRTARQMEYRLQSGRID